MITLICRLAKLHQDSSLASTVVDQELVPKKLLSGSRQSDISHIKVICAGCREMVDASRGNAANLFKHLKRERSIHSDQYNSSQNSADQPKRVFSSCLFPVRWQGHLPDSNFGFSWAKSPPLCAGRLK